MRLQYLGANMNDLHYRGVALFERCSMIKENGIK